MPEKSKVRIEVIAWKSGRPVTELPVADGTTLKEILVRWAVINPDIAEVGFNIKEQKLTGVMAVVVNDLLVTDVNTEVHNGDNIVLVPVVDGG